MRKFNVTGICVPEENFMVDLTEKLKQIKVMVDEKEYFTINRGRQYGKSTTLLELEKFLSDEYTVISISFEGFDEEEFANAENFCQKLLGRIYDALLFTSESQEYCESWKNLDVKGFDDLGRHITAMSRDKKLVLMVDEVDKASNNRVFLGFLSKLREKFLARKARKDFTFHSVILAGVYDIKNIKLKLIQEGLHTSDAGETTTHNSPWNIAAQFKVDMSFSIPEIKTMLVMYEQERQMEINIGEVAAEIYQYTSGYPVLVSTICKYIDEDLAKQWEAEGVRRAVKLLVAQKENIPLFDSLFKYLENDPNVYKFMYSVLFSNQHWSFMLGNPTIALCYRYGLIESVDKKVKISNKIFEILLIEYFVSKEKMESLLETKAVIPENYSGIIGDGKFNMQTCLEKFAKYYHQHYSDKDIEFIERESRFFFLFFLNPILNGHGFAHIESHFTDDRRMDVVVNYLNQQFVIELKIWRGEKRHEEAYEQLQGYMDKLSLDEGYLLTFDFREDKLQQQKWVEVRDGMKIFDMII